MVDPKTERTARAICRVEAQRYADRLQQEPWIDMNWPSFVPHARAALEAMLKLPPLDAGAVFNDDGIETVAMTIYERNDSVKSLSEARDISAAAVRVMAEHFRVNGWPTYRTGIPAEQIVEPALKALLDAG